MSTTATVPSPHLQLLHGLLPSPMSRSAAVKDRTDDGMRDKTARESIAGPARAVLGRVNTNTAPRPTPTLKRGLPRSTSIPRPSPTPDVFLDELTVARSLGKRARNLDPNPVPPSKRSKADAAKLAAKSHRDQQEVWLAKWQKAFPTLVFHFEIGVEDGAGRGRLRSRVTKLGARIDQFFSQRVSHLIVKGTASPQRRTAARKGKVDLDNPFLDRTGETDLVAKADKLGIKVWPLKKLIDMVDKLDPVVAEETDQDSLSTLLAHEKLHGTRERDYSAPRPDYYYFKPSCKYLLVEDATGRNRPVMVKEYAGKDRGWPELHEHFLKFSSSTSDLPPSVEESANLAHDLRERARTLYVEQMPYRDEQPPAPSLKRSNSCNLRNIAVTPLPEAMPYDKASGNSVVLTSNIASTSAANHTPGYVNGMPQLGANRDRAIMQMSKRVQVLKGNARLAAAGKKPSPLGQENRVPESVSRLPLNRRKSTGMEAAPAAAPAREFLSQAQVVSMLRQLRGPTAQTKPSYEERRANRQRVDAGLDQKDQDTASGYCENCRIRYTNLSIHVKSKKHRRFAENDTNFIDLDQILQCIQRPPNPIMCVPTAVCRPCYTPHSKDEPCKKCSDDPALYSSPAPSSLPGSTRKEYPEYRVYGDESGDEDEGDDDLQLAADKTDQHSTPLDFEVLSEALGGMVEL